MSNVYAYLFLNDRELFGFFDQYLKAIYFHPVSGFWMLRCLNFIGQSKQQDHGKIYVDH